MTQRTENPEHATLANRTIKTPGHAVPTHTSESDEHIGRKTGVADVMHRLTRRQKRWFVTILGLIMIVAVMIWQSHRPKLVSVVRPTLVTITESLTSTGRVGGVTEAAIGAQATGIVDRLLVREGDEVVAGQQLAIMKRDVAEAQVAQAQAALNTARAQLAQTARDPLPSDVEAAAENVRQAQAQLNQQRAAVIQARQSVAQARAQYSQLETERDLILKEYARSTSLAARGFISQAELDQVEANSQVAEKKLLAQGQALAVAQANVTAAQAAVEAAQANARAQEAHLQTVQTGSRPEDILVAQERVEEAEYALRVARQQAANALVTAPFAGIVTEIYAEVGQTVGSQGVLQLVSDETEIRVDVDESNLADLAIGQAAILSSNTFRDSTFRGTVSEIAAAVDATRGTVTVTVIPTEPPDWLRPGQTVNVNIVTNPAAERLVIPKTATTRVGDRTGVLVVENGRAQYQTVVLRPPIAQGVPVLAGLTAHDDLIANAQGIEPGEAVRTRSPATTTKD